MDVFLASDDFIDVTNANTDGLYDHGQRRNEAKGIYEKMEYDLSVLMFLIFMIHGIMGKLLYAERSWK